MSDIKAGDRVSWMESSRNIDRPEFPMEGVVRRLRQRNEVEEALVRPTTLTGFDLFVRVDRLTKLPPAAEQEVQP